MANKKVGLRMASATKSDIKDLYTLYHVIELMHSEGVDCISGINDFEHLDLDKKEKNFLSQIFEDGEINTEIMVHYLKGLLHGFHRVVMGYEVLHDNTADKSLNYLDFNKDIKEAFNLWNHIEEHLKEGRKICITPDSVWGKIILDTDEKEADNG